MRLFSKGFCDFYIKPALFFTRSILPVLRLFILRLPPDSLISSDQIRLASGSVSLLLVMKHNFAPPVRFVERTVWFLYKGAPGLVFLTT